MKKTGNIFPADDDIAAICDLCGGEVYRNDLAHFINGFTVCAECFFDFAFEYFSDCLLTGSEIKELCNTPDT